MELNQFSYLRICPIEQFIFGSIIWMILANEVRLYKLWSLTVLTCSSI